MSWCGGGGWGGGGGRFWASLKRFVICDLFEGFFLSSLCSLSSPPFLPPSDSLFPHHSLSFFVSLSPLSLSLSSSLSPLLSLPITPYLSVLVSLLPPSDSLSLSPSLSLSLSP